MPSLYQTNGQLQAAVTHLTIICAKTRPLRNGAAAWDRSKIRAVVESGQSSGGARGGKARLESGLMRKALTGQGFCAAAPERGGRVVE